jgi:hypothetical protein
MKSGDISRARRLADPARQRWYARYRAVRFARRMRLVLEPHETAGPYVAAIWVMAAAPCRGL